MTKSWIILFIAGLLEITWTIGLKYSDGFKNIKWTIFTAVMTIASVIMLGIAVKHLPLGTAYAVWTGIGAIGTVTLGMILFGESSSPIRLFCIFLIFAGIAGLKLVSDGSTNP